MVLTAERFKKLLLLAVGLSLILVAGSRISFLLFPVGVFLVYLFSLRRLRSTHVAFLLVSASFLLAGMGSVVYLFREEFRYLADLGQLYGTSDLTALNAVRLRLDAWGTRWALFDGVPGVSKWLIGIGPWPIMRVADNDYLYMFIRYGAVGIAFNLLLVALLWHIFSSVRDSAVAIIGKEYLLLGLVYGVAYEMLSSWSYPLLLFFLAGVAGAIAFNRTKAVHATGGAGHTHSSPPHMRPRFSRPPATSE